MASDPTMALYPYAHSSYMVNLSNSGYDSVFDHRAAKAGYNTPEAVKQFQEKFGTNVDGKWGQQTWNASR